LGASTSSGPASGARHILTNGKIITVDDQFSIAQAVASRRRSYRRCRHQRGHHAAGGRTTAPDRSAWAFRAARFHRQPRALQEEGAYWSLELRFDGITSRKQAWELLQARRKACGPGQVGLQPGRLVSRPVREDKKLPTRDELDKYFA
jgi:hypothetical protein